LSNEKLLGHQHANAGWGKYADAHIAGSSFFMQTLELACVLQDVGYGGDRERIGFDIVPFNEEPVAAIRRSIVQWEFIYDLASKVDRAQLGLARKNRVASLGQEAVYAALGLDSTFLEKLRRERTEHPQ
jgi:xylose isomerase